jgi:hypothetical protein
VAAANRFWESLGAGFVSPKMCTGFCFRQRRYPMFPNQDKSSSRRRGKRRQFPPSGTDVFGYCSKWVNQVE